MDVVLSVYWAKEIHELKGEYGGVGCHYLSLKKSHTYFSYE